MMDAVFNESQSGLSARSLDSLCDQRHREISGIHRRDGAIVAAFAETVGAFRASPSSRRPPNILKQMRMSAKLATAPTIIGASGTTKRRCSGKCLPISQPPIIGPAIAPNLPIALAHPTPLERIAVGYSKPETAFKPS
jgi:hypothetical protein